MEESATYPQRNMRRKNMLLNQLAEVQQLFKWKQQRCWYNSLTTAIYQYNNNNDRLTAFDPGQPG